MSDATVEFSVLCNMFDAVERAKKGQQKRKCVQKFLDLYTDHEYFSALRLMCPGLDKLRNNYGLQPTVLGKHLVEASGLGKDTKDAQKLLNWRKGGTRAGSNAGNFALVAQEVLLTRQRVTSTGLKIKDVNDMLDRLADAKTKGEKVPVLAEMYNKTNTHDMRWIIMIILKELKLGISDKTILGEFHPDAVELYSNRGDFKFVCEALRHRNERYKNLSIQVGKSIAPQRLSRVKNVEEAWKKLRGKEVTVECKFDGERIQIHKDGTRLNFYSRNHIDHHQKYEPSLGDVLIRNVLPEKCILDGEMLSWDTEKKCFLEFGNNKKVAKAAREGLETNQQNVYVAFDLLYTDSGSLIHLPLRQRQELLCKAIRPVKYRLEILNPTPGLKKTQHSGSDRDWFHTGKSAEEIEHFFKQLVKAGIEGIVLKDLDSNWEPADRTGKWLKLKPDYTNPVFDLDALIIGGYFGSGRHGGQIAQFLLGIAEKPKGGGEPTKFISFCKVGTGLNGREHARIIEKLNPYFKRNEKNSKPPSCYKVTNHSKERPDVWVLPPEESVILEVNCDQRPITTEVFASRIGLRFPRVSGVRWTKLWNDCLDEETLQDMVSNSGQQGTVDSEDEKIGNKPKESRKAKKAKTNILPLVPSHMRNTDVSNVKPTSKIFTGRMFYFINTSVEHSKESLHKLVVGNGGQFSMNLNNSVTHAIASERRGLKFQSAAAHGDVIHSSWILDCCTAKTLLPVNPKYFLHLSNQTKEKRKDEIDDFGDHYFADIDVADLAQIFKNIDTAVVATDYEKLAHYKKHCSSLTFSRFSDSNFYFHTPIHSSNPDSQMVADAALKRQELEVSMHGGTVSETLQSSVTHMIVYTSSEKTLPFRNVVKSIASQDRWMLMLDTLEILSHRWIDDYTIGKCGHGEEGDYDLRDPSFEFDEKSMKRASNSEDGSPTEARRGVKRPAE